MKKEREYKELGRHFIFYSLLPLLLFGCSKSNNGDLMFIEPGQDDSFEFPYFLFIPDQLNQNKESYVIIEPNNSGFADDNLQEHIDKAERTATIDFYLGNYVAQNLNYPLLVPVFPRPKSNWNIYTHSLDRDVMLQKGNPLERLDNQLIEMFLDAQAILKSKNIQTNDQFLLTGFSASGTFANRFTLIHPDRVFAVAAGGLNGLLMLPMDSLKSEAMNYPIGTSDFETLTNKVFDSVLFKNTPQFYFMGQLDDNDAVPFDDAYDQIEREQIYRLLGEEMQPDRWIKCMQIYKTSNINATFKTYEEIGHEHPELIKENIIEFFKSFLEET